MKVAQQIAGIWWQFLNRAGSHFVVRLIGRRQDCSQRNPNSSDGGHQVQFPAIDLAMPARFGPVRVGFNRRVRDDPFFRNNRSG